MPKNKRILTGEHFYKFFQCPHWLWYDLYEDASRKKTIPPLLQMIYEGGIKHKEKALASKKFDEVKPELFKDLDEAFLSTLELMKQGKNVFHGVLLDEDWAGMPDLLEKRPMSELGMPKAKSRFGDYYYVVYDIRDNSEMRDEYKFQLVLYSLILERIQGVLPREAYVINADGEEKSFFIEDFIDYFHVTKEQIEKILDGERPPPFLKSGCRRTPWYTICLEETEGCGDVSLVYRLSQQDQRQLYEVGIKTVKDLAEADINELYKKLPNLYFDKLMRFQNQAQVLLSKEPIVLKKPEFPKVKHEIYFDIESDPTEGIDYLLGFWIKDKNSKATDGKYKYFFAKDKSEEEKIWKELIDFIESFDDFVIYHYAFYERKVFDRLSQRYGASWDTIKKFKDNSLDLLNYVTESVVLPLYFYGLKDVAKYIGYKWKDDQAGGAESVVWYNDWLEKGDKKILKRILDYNRDDVIATAVVKEWLETQRPKKEREVLPKE